MKPILLPTIRRKPKFKRRYRIASRADRNVHVKSEAFLDKPSHAELPNRRAKLVMMSKDVERYVKAVGDGSLADGLETLVDLMQDLEQALQGADRFRMHAARANRKTKKLVRTT